MPRGLPTVGATLWAALLRDGFPLHPPKLAGQVRASKTRGLQEQYKVKGQQIRMGGKVWGVYVSCAVAADHTNSKTVLALGLEVQG